MTQEPHVFSKNDQYYQGVRTDLIELVPSINGAVFEIGCAEGKTLEYIRSKFDCTVAGVDYCDSAVSTAQAKGLNVCKCDLNIEPLPFSETEFDYILVGDVLEHLYDPWRILKDLSLRLKNDGRLLISIPNVKHYYILRDLILKDQWEYQESGLLDISHVRFFTLTSSQKLIEESGLEIDTLKYSMSASPKMRWLNKLLSGKLDSYLAFHFLICAKKR
jgi:2-polyprenyl-3-methyl-5-hydroxy-6-metoxy-1,4-benzoquinol methylase